MILPAQTIRSLCIHKDMIKPFSDRTVVHGSTFGLSPAGYDIRIAEEFQLGPGDFALGSSIERFKIPLHILGVVHDKSSWARQGICVQNTVLEPGWEGYLTLELTNHGRGIRMILKGSPIAQIVFHVLTEDTQQPYTGKYQNAPEGPQPVIFEGKT